MSYSLLTFGIQCHFLHENNGTSEIQRQYLQRRMEIEKREKEDRAKEEAWTGVILYPAPYDVLLGRGRPNQEFSGNRRFAVLIDSQMERFQNCSSQFEKTCVIMDVVKTVHDSGGRFLKRRSDGWEVVSDSVARKKAGGTFRTRTELAAVQKSPSLVSSSSAVPSPKYPERKRVKYDPNEVLLFS
jgi:hypothetical protein